MKEKGGRASVAPLGFECAFWRGFMTVSPGPGNYHPSVCGNFIRLRKKSRSLGRHCSSIEDEHPIRKDGKLHRKDYPHNKRVQLDFHCLECLR